MKLYLKKKLQSVAIFKKISLHSVRQTKFHACFIEKKRLLIINETLVASGFYKIHPLYFSRFLFIFFFSFGA
jgi:hypothetical protein